MTEAGGAVADNGLILIGFQRSAVGIDACEIHKWYDRCIFARQSLRLWLTLSPDLCFFIFVEVLLFAASFSYPLSLSEWVVYFASSRSGENRHSNWLLEEFSKSIGGGSTRQKCITQRPRPSAVGQQQSHNHGIRHGDVQCLEHWNTCHRLREHCRRKSWTSQQSAR